MRKMLSLLFVAIFLISSVALADNGTYKWRDWRYRLTYGGKCELVEYVGSEKNIKLPENINGYPVYSLAQFAFSNCSGIESITISKSVNSIDEFAFADTRDLVSIDVVEDNRVFDSKDGVLFNKITSTLVHYPSSSPLLSYAVPEGTVTIGSSAFWVCTYLEQLTFPNTLQRFEDAAITWCEKLKEIEIPSCVTTLGIETMSYCTELETVYLPDSVSEIGIFSFARCADNFKLVVEKGSYAEQYARDAQKSYVYSSEYTRDYDIGNDETSDSVNLTISNCPDFATILAIRSSGDSRYARFASKYRGDIIEFDGRIDYVTNHRSYKTRYDILVFAGDYDPEHQIGPAFKFEDVAAYDLDLDTLYLEDEIWVGRNVHVIAEVASYDSVSELFYLIPISVTGR